MKAIKSPTFLIQNLLISLSITLALLGFFLASKSFPFFPSVEILSEGVQTNVEIGQGTMFMSHLFLFLSFISVYLIFELYSFKPAIYTAINVAVMIWVTYGLFLLLQNFVLDPLNSQFDHNIQQLIFHPFKSVIILSAATLTGFMTALILAASIKALTRNYFMFIRFPIATVIGFAVFTIIDVFFQEVNLSSPFTMLLNGITPLSHFLALTIVSVVPLYVLRLIFGLFRGHVKNEDSVSRAPSAPLFKSAEVQEIPAVQESVSEIAIEPKPELSATIPQTSTTH